MNHKVENEPTVNVEVISAGDYVRSYDFPDVHKDCFVEGVVVAILTADQARAIYGVPASCDVYRIEVKARVWAGKDAIEPNEFVYAPKNGTPTLFGGVTNGVCCIVTADGMSSLPESKINEIIWRSRKGL